MKRTEERYRTYIEILERELVPAMGCTEPIALAYCAARARAVLGELPEKVVIGASGNIIKNVKSVVVPNTDGRKGIEAAAAAGIVAGDPERSLEVIASVSAKQKEELDAYLKTAEITVHPVHTEHILDITVEVWKGEHSAKVRIADEHTNIIQIEKDGEVLLDLENAAETPDTVRMPGMEPSVVEASEALEEEDPDYSLLDVEHIYDFACTADLSDVKTVLERQICYNSAISKEGLANPYGANIGKVLLTLDQSLRTRAKAAAAAASDARMNGCELPVVINSGSGNQGITASMPVLEYAKEIGAEEDLLYRSLLISNLITLHLKSGIGRLSAYCGAVSAGAGAGAGIAFLLTKDLNIISHTIVNALAITSGIVCDGAKSSCAAKIAAAVDAGIMGFEMYRNGQQFYDGEGLVSKGVENTIRNIGILGRDGMSETDKKIIEIMTGC